MFYRIDLLTKLLIKYLKHQIKPVLGMIFLLLLGLFLQITAPQLIGQFIDGLTSGVNGRILTKIALVFIGLSILSQLTTIGTVHLSQMVAWESTNSLRLDLLRHCLHLDISFHKSLTPGELIERVDGDVSLLSGFFSRLVIQIFGNGLFLLGILLVLFTEDWRVGIAMSIFATLSILTLLKLQNSAILSWQAYRQWSGIFYGYLGEKLEGREDIKGNGATNYVFSHFHRILNQWLPVYHQARFTSTLLWGSSVGLFTLGNTIALGLATWLSFRQTISLGTAFLIFYYANLIAQPIEQIRQHLEEFQQVEAIILRIQKLLQVSPKILDRGNSNLPLGSLSVSFNQVEFSYQDTPTLCNISFSLSEGKTLGIIGKTGSGKTTIGRLLLRLYDVNRGSIKLSGIDIRDVPLHSLRQSIGIVTQNIYLLQGSLRDNVSLFDSNISDNRIIEAIELVGLGSWLNRFPRGINSEINPVQLSAGEAQLLALARLFLQSPGLIILDEASSHLDEQTEREVSKVMKRLFFDRTIIIIAHRLQTLQTADQVLVLEQGRIVEYNDRISLLSDTNSYFYKMFFLS